MGKTNGTLQGVTRNGGPSASLNAKVPGRGMGADSHHHREAMECIKGCCTPWSGAKWRQLPPRWPLLQPADLSKSPRGNWSRLIPGCPFPGSSRKLCSSPFSMAKAALPFDSIINGVAQPVDGKAGIPQEQPQTASVVQQTTTSGRFLITLLLFFVKAQEH